MEKGNYKAGFIYFNRQDSRVFVPKRFGIGYSFNFANPVTWIILAVLIGVIAARFYFS